ncbi:MAG TPA: glycosyltransferase [Acetobacteraceae bacterium]|nr:glycosyltransferase [Acetobacteraceae bacterium]
MDQFGEAAAPATATGGGATGGVLIAIPFFQNEHLVDPVLRSLIACKQELAAIGAEVICYNDSPDHAPLRDVLAAAVREASAHFPCRLETNARNLGFVRTMNQAVAAAVARQADLLLLNSDTVVEPGALAEMVVVAALDHMTGFVSPRSNNATLATLPLRAPPPAAAARAAYAALADMLPRTAFVPTAVGFCLLIRAAVLAEFGGFDEIYGRGYNEENDLVMRAGRCGYRAVLANRAFVWHEGEKSFGGAAQSRDRLEPVNRAILDERYPEYAGHTCAYYKSPEAIAEELLAATLPDAAGRRDIAFDFSSFRAAHNGTFEAGRQLLATANRVWGEDFRVHVLCGEEVYAFHDYAALGVPRADPHGGGRFAIVFRVGQPYDWNVLERLAPAAAVFGVYMLDTISIDCPQLASPLLYDMWQLTLDHADVVAMQSEQTRDQFRRRFRMPHEAIETVSYHSLDLAEYALPAAAEAAPDPAGGILVLGNHFHHKYLNQTANALATAFPDRQVTALGPNGDGAKRDVGPLDPPPLVQVANLRVVAVGALDQAAIGAEYGNAEIVVFPSHAEGFGFPVLHALAARRPVFVRRLPVFEEIWRALNGPANMHFFTTTADLVERLRQPPRWVEEAAPAEAGGAERSAREIRDALLRALQGVTYDRIVRRLRAVQLASAVAGQNAMPAASDTKAAEAARFLALKTERITLRLLRNGFFYGAMRLGFRALRNGRRLLRRRGEISAANARGD